MLRATTLLLLIGLNAGLSYGMQCSFGKTNILQKVIDSCPGIFDSSDKSYCCYNIENNTTYCCDAVEFAMLSSWTVVTVIVIVVIVISIVIFCISCLCCVFCRRYRRRNQGMVYENVQVPSVIHVIQTPANIPQPVVNSTIPPEMSQPSVHPNDIYAKQPQYNLYRQ